MNMVKQLVKAIPILLLSGLAYCADSQLSLTDFGGKVDFITSDKVQDKYALDLLNCYTDEQGMVVKRRGYAKYNPTAITGGLNIKRMFTYNLSNGDSYIIVNSSNSLLYSTGNGLFTTIISTLTVTAEDDYTVANGVLYRNNGVDTPGKWNATTKVYTPLTVANSTNPVTGKYIEYFHNRLFVCGITGDENRVYYSAVADPDNTEGYINININDGDWITAIYKFGDSLWVFKRYSIYQIKESGNAFVVNTLSNKIGCLYHDTIDEYKGFPIFLSHRGVEMYDGQFNLVSEPIDILVKGLRQMNLSQGSWTQDLASDWGAGSGTNIDTTTYSGSVALTSSTLNQYQYSGVSKITIFTPVEFTKHRQSFMLSHSGYIEHIDMKFWRGGLNSLGDMTISIVDVSSNTIVSSSFSVSAIPVGDSYRDIRFSDYTNLNADTTYYIVISSISNSSDPSISDVHIWGNNTPSTYTRGEFTRYVPSQNLWTTSAISGIYGDAYFGIFISSSIASFTSSTMTATNWGSWGSFSVNDTQPSGSAITYFIKTSTASDNFSTKPLQSVTNGAIISTTTGNYIQVISSFSRTVATAIPKLNDFTITWQATTSNNPCAMVFKDRYHLFVSTDDSGNHTYNDIDLVYQKNGDWTMFNDIYASANTIFRGNWLSGNSNGNGFIYTQDVDNLYSDDGSAYSSYYVTKSFNMDSINEKLMKSLYVTAENSGNWNLDMDYRLDGYTSNFSTGTVSLNGTNKIITSKLNLPLVPKSRYIQLRFGNNTINQFFKIKRLDLIYEVLPLN